MDRESEYDEYDEPDDGATGDDLERDLDDEEDEFGEFLADDEDEDEDEDGDNTDDRANALPTDKIPTFWEQQSQRYAAGDNEDAEDEDEEAAEVGTLDEATQFALRRASRRLVGPHQGGSSLMRSQHRVPESSTAAAAAAIDFEEEACVSDEDAFLLYHEQKACADAPERVERVMRVAARFERAGGYRALGSGGLSVPGATARRTSEAPAAPGGVRTTLAAARPLGGPGDGGGGGDAASSMRNSPPVKVYFDVAMDPKTGLAVLPIKLKGLLVHSLGTVVWDRPKFHSKKYVWPAGFHSTREYASLLTPNRQVKYDNRIVDAGDHPMFIVTSEEFPDAPFISNTASGAWQQIGDRLSALKFKVGVNASLLNTQVSGPANFGFAVPSVARLIQLLPNVDKCLRYQRVQYVHQDSPLVSPAEAAAAATARIHGRDLRGRGGPRTGRGKTQGTSAAATSSTSGQLARKRQRTGTLQDRRRKVTVLAHQTLAHQFAVKL